MRIIYFFCCCLFLFLPLSGNIAQTLEDSYFIDFGPDDGSNGDRTISPDANDTHWTNLTDPMEGSSATLVKADGSNSTISIAVLTTLSKGGKQLGGLLSPDAALLGELAIATATQDYFFTAETATLKFTQLDPDRAYRFSLFGSRTNAEKRVSKYTLAGANTAELELQTSGRDLGGSGYDGNNSTVAVSDFIFPDADGSILLEVGKLEGSFAYLCLLKLEMFSGVDLTKVSAISIEGTDISENATTRQMTATVLPADATVPGVSWEVKEKSIASITEDGLLIPFRNGMVTVVAKAVERGSTVRAEKEILISNQDVVNVLL
ncbi:MAG: hypothetical protein AAFO94_20910, partial [Bacteroidota bacterium]